MVNDRELVVDLRGRLIETLNDFWDAVSEPCGLPEWFGRNLDAWSDTIEARGISEVIDSRDVLIVHVDQQGLFERNRSEAHVLADIFDGEQNQLIRGDSPVVPSQANPTERDVSPKADRERTDQQTGLLPAAERSRGR